MRRKEPLPDRHPWKVGEVYAVRERYGKGREVYRARVIRLTPTQVLTVTELATTEDHPVRWRRSTGWMIDRVYGDRKLCPVEAPKLRVLQGGK